jgi:hypothetical protein
MWIQSTDSGCFWFSVFANDQSTDGQFSRLISSSWRIFDSILMGFLVGFLLDLFDPTVETCLVWFGGLGLEVWARV